MEVRMGHRTLSLGLVFRALFLDAAAFDELREDDNPFVEGLFLIVIMGAITALLALIGQLLAWASTPDMAAIKDVVFRNLQQMPWWSAASAASGFAEEFRRWYDLGWQIFPALSGAPNPAGAAFNILLWPLAMLLNWLVYGLLAHLFARMLGGRGNLGQTLGLTALASTPLLLRGLGFIPFLVIGGVMNTWQLILRYKAVRTAHALPWSRAFWATLLPFLVYLLFWLMLGGIGVVLLALVTAGR
jgi:hypothetical protein